MSLTNLEWYGWVIFVLTMCSLWSDGWRAYVIASHADKIKGGEALGVIGQNFIWTAIGIAVTLYWMLP